MAMDLFPMPNQYQTMIRFALMHYMQKGVIYIRREGLFQNGEKISYKYYSEKISLCQVLFSFCGFLRQKCVKIKVKTLTIFI